MKRSLISPFFEHGLSVELAAIFRTGAERAHIDRHDALVLETLGNIAAYNPKSLRNTLMSMSGSCDRDGAFCGRPQNRESSPGGTLLGLLSGTLRKNPLPSCQESAYRFRQAKTTCPDTTSVRGLGGTSDCDRPPAASERQV